MRRTSTRKRPPRGSLWQTALIRWLGPETGQLAAAKRDSETQAIPRRQ